MAYETGTATSVNDLLAKLAIFAVAQGWTANRNTAAAGLRELCLSKGTAYFNLKSYEVLAVSINGTNPTTPTTRSGIALNGSDGYSGVAVWDRQPGYPVRTGGAAGSDQGHANMGLWSNVGPFPAYHFFTPDSKCIFVELEESTGMFLRFGFGSLDLFNVAAPGGGRFFYATGGGHSTVNHVAADADATAFGFEMVPFRAADYTTTPSLSGSWLRAAVGSFNGWAHSARSVVASYSGQPCQGGGVHDKTLRDAAPNPLNGVGVLMPNVVSVDNAGHLQPVGIVPGMRYMDMSLYVPGDEFALGADVWKVFPWGQKGGGTFQRGIAYKKVV